MVEKFAKYVIEHYFPYSQIESGRLENEYNVRLIKLMDTKYQQISDWFHARGYSMAVNSNSWILKTALSWGGNTGWNVTTDYKYALCRTAYDSYHLFEVEPIKQGKKSEQAKIHKNQTKYAAEFYVAAELYRRGFNVGMMLGNTEDIDLLAAKGGKSFQVQVKGIQKTSSINWNMKRTSAKEGILYVLVNLHADTVASPEFFVLDDDDLQSVLKEVKSKRDYINYSNVKNQGFGGAWWKFG